MFSVDKRYMAPNLNIVDVPDLNRLLRSMVFMSKEKQLKAVHLILDFKPLFNKFQGVGNMIKAGDPWLAWINISVPRFLAREGTMQVELPSRRFPHEEVVTREKTASLSLSLKAEIDQF